MSLERPAWLLLLAALPILWLLHRRLRRPATLTVSSVLPFLRAGAPAPSALPRRGTDVTLLLLLLASAALALAAAGPAIGAGAPRPEVRGLLDTSPSMDARLSGGESAREAALRLAEELVAAAAPGARLLVREAPEGAAAALAAHLEAARTAGFPGLLVVTDEPLEGGPGIAVVGPPGVAGPNAAVLGAVLDGGEAVVTVGSSSDRAAEHGLLALDAEGEVVARAQVAVPAGGVASARLPAPPRGATWTYALSGADALAADDRLAATRLGGVARIRLVGRAPRTADALRAYGPVEIVDRGPADLEVVHGGVVGEAPTLPTLHLAPREALPGSAFRLSVRGDPRIPGRAVTASGVAELPLPSPGAILVAPRSVAGGEAWWRAPEGAVVAAARGAVVVAADPEEAASDWHRDASFPALVAAAVDRLTDGPERLVAGGGPPPSDSALPRTVRPAPPVAEVAALVRRAGPADATDLGAPLSLVGAACAAAAALGLRRRR